jgi:hypothetical protein
VQESGYLFGDGYNIPEGDPLSKRAVDLIFSATYTLTDLRMILRETAPAHELDERQRTEATRLLENLERQVGSLKQEMLK